MNFYQLAQKSFQIKGRYKFCNYCTQLLIRTFFPSPSDGIWQAKLNLSIVIKKPCLRVATCVMEYTCTELQVLQQSLYILSVWPEHVVHQGHALSQEDVNKLAATLKTRVKLRHKININSYNNKQEQKTVTISIFTDGQLEN